MLGRRPPGASCRPLSSGCSVASLATARPLRQGLAELLKAQLAPLQASFKVGAARPFVVFMVGVNGAGKTTTMGKLARRLQEAGHSVLLAAGDTFRAAAVEQLQLWGATQRRSGGGQGAGERTAPP